MVATVAMFLNLSESLHKATELKNSKFIDIYKTR